MTLVAIALLLMLLCAAAVAHVAPGRVKTPHGRALTRRFARAHPTRLFWPDVETRPG